MDFVALTVYILLVIIFLLYLKHCLNWYRWDLINLLAILLIGLWIYLETHIYLIGIWILIALLQSLFQSINEWIRLYLWVLAIIYPIIMLYFLWETYTFIWILIHILCIPIVIYLIEALSKLYRKYIIEYDCDLEEKLKKKNKWKKVLH